MRPLIEISQERVADGREPLFQSHMWDGSAVELEENLQIADELLEACAEGEDRDGDRDRRRRRRGGRRRQRDQREALHDPGRRAAHRRGARAPGEVGRYLLAATFGNVHGVYKPGNVKLRPVDPQGHPGRGRRASSARSKPFDLVFHGGSGSLLEEIRETLDYGVVKMNVDTDTQYAFTRPIADHMFTQLRRRAQGRRRGRQQEAVRPARLRQGGRGGHGRPGRRGLRGPALGRHLARQVVRPSCARASGGAGRRPQGFRHWLDATRQESSAAGIRRGGHPAALRRVAARAAGGAARSPRPRRPRRPRRPAEPVPEVDDGERRWPVDARRRPVAEVAVDSETASRCEAVTATVIGLSRHVVADRAYRLTRARRSTTRLRPLAPRLASPSDVRRTPGRSRPAPPVAARRRHSVGSRAGSDTAAHAGHLAAYDRRDVWQRDRATAGSSPLRPRSGQPSLDPAPTRRRRWPTAPGPVDSSARRTCDGPVQATVRGDRPAPQDDRRRATATGDLASTGTAAAVSARGWTRRHGDGASGDRRDAVTAHDRRSHRVTSGSTES